MATTPIAVQQDETEVEVSTKPKKTILGVKLRRLITGTVRSLARGKNVKVVFRGTRARTDGTTMILPKINDLAEIPYDKARALIGYAIHELGHILYTDFEQVERAFNEGKLVKKFENCIEDYRIERELTDEFPGAKEDLTALRIRIHPRLSDLTTGWLRDPRACGPLALTWTGSMLNGFENPHLQQTLDAIAPPVLALIEDWTRRMRDVVSTKEAVDLAIVYKAEADAYAQRTQLPDMTKPEKPDAAKEKQPPEAEDQKPLPQDGQDPGNGSSDFDFQNGPSSSDESTTPSGQGDPRPDENGSINMNDGLLDENNAEQDEANPSAQAQSTGEEDEPVQKDDQSDRTEDAPTQGPAHDDPDDDHGFGDALDEQAQIEDILDDMADQIAADVRQNGALPEEAPEATDGEVDPSSLEEDVDAANEPAPNYVSNDDDVEDENDDERQAGSPRSGNSTKGFPDKRFVPVRTETNACQYENLEAAASGVITTTARTIKRLLMAESQGGIYRNRRAGQFDVRNISAIARSTGTCYKKVWTKPAPTTLLVVLTDFSSSMEFNDITEMLFGKKKSLEPTPLEVAMMGSLAIARATEGTQIKTALYGYTGHSPYVTLSVFKEGNQSRQETRKRMGAYKTIQTNCTPTAEAMAAVAERIDAAAEDRVVLLVLTDGQADNMNLCKDVSHFYHNRGIDVVAIGIKNNSVEEWAPVSHVIHDIKDLPNALLSTIDPRASKKRRRAA